MATQETQWTKLADLSEVPVGEAKAMRIGEGRSIASVACWTCSLDDR